MKKWFCALCALMVCTVLLFSACGGKQDTPFSQPAQGGAPASVPVVSVPTVSAPDASGAQGGVTHPFGDGASSSAQTPAASGASSSAAQPVVNPSSASSSAAENTGAVAAGGSRGATVRADGGLRLRAGAGTDSESLLTIPDGTHLTCTGWQNGWAKTTYEGKTGYVSAEYLLLDGKVNADGGLRLRSGPGETHEKLLTIPNGTTLAFTEEKDGWLKTTYDGKTGYVSQEYIAISATVTAGPGLNLRETASESGTKLTTIPNGAEVQCLGSRDGAWIKVAYNGYAGYVSAQYLSFN